MAEIVPINLQVQGVVGGAGEAGADLTRVGGKVMLATDNRVYEGIIRRYLSGEQWELSVESNVLQIPELVEALQPNDRNSLLPRFRNSRARYRRGAR